MTGPSEKLLHSAIGKTPLTPEEIAELSAISPLMHTVYAWRQWKRTHDRASAQHNCCKFTEALFHSLDELEREILDL